ncbi:HesB/IscA family protein [Ornithinimicrobium murale]|uniref:HesB/IscA family protein n=1 Tax=Ornithinimicrobium murale TaxID=1050153 RepID=UPI000E0D0CF1|nr:iron-sulfur cluster assembly accessory protein [Ornithinimicrobium murale]
MKKSETRPQADQTCFPPFTVTQAAVQQIEALGGAVRVDVEDGGCSGTSYTFTQGVDQKIDDARYGCHGAWLVVGQRARSVLAGATLDYSARLRPPRFRVIKNPNTPEVCPCRRSFGEPWPGPGQPTCRSYRPMPWDTDYEPPVDWQRRTSYGRPEASS